MMEYANYLCAMLEPDAIEKFQFGTFSYPVSSDETKFLIASFYTRLGDSGRMETRNPQRPAHLRDVILNGMASNSTAIVLDPTRANYIDPQGTYNLRLQKILESSVKHVDFSSPSQSVPFLPGAYGAIIVQVTCFDFAWIVLHPRGNSKYGINLWDEISDSLTQRVGDQIRFPVSKQIAGQLVSSSKAGTLRAGSVSYVLLDENWSAINDPLSYTFRDDFMSNVIDENIWSITQSITGNVEIDNNYQWLKLFGNGIWGSNGIYRTVTDTRTDGKSMMLDVYIPQGGSTYGVMMVGWSNANGQHYSNLSHGLNFGPNGILNIYEDGVKRSDVGTGYSDGCIYRVKLTLGVDGSSKYLIQGGLEYPELGSDNWYDITPLNSHSETLELSPSATAYKGQGYISDIRVMQE